MKKVTGLYNEAVIYTDVVEDSAVEQIQVMCDLEFLKDSHIRIMPDVHTGAGCTIGTTMLVKDKVVPNLVGVDIGCGMYTVKLQEKDIDYQKIDEICHYIPSGMNVWESMDEKFDLTQLRCFSNLKSIKRLQCSLGTLGGGNHFIEIDEDNDGNKYLVIHSGSRNLGTQVANYYQNLAVDLNHGKEEYLLKRDEIIRTYKELNRQQEIEKALNELKWETRDNTIPDALCYLYGSYLEDYLHDLDICQKFAERNRQKMAEIILEKSGYHVQNSFQTIHNYIDMNKMILRKGAISAQKDEKVLIPINMRDGSIIAVGKGNPEWNYSAPHGAGRIMSRSKAFAEINLDEFKETMQGIYTTSVNASTIDESPMAYKSLSDITENIRDTVDIIDIIKPVYNFKASDLKKETAVKE